MTLKIEKASDIGFCFGVRRALDILEKTVLKQGKIETLGAIVHNRPVLRKLAASGVRIAGEIANIKGDIVAVSAHGISPQVERELKARRIEVIDTTCPFVRRAQIAARRLSRAGFFVVIYGDTLHPEIKGVLGWADRGGKATLDAQAIAGLKPLPRRIGVLSQTTQVPAHFNEFVKDVVGTASGKDSELRIIDTICHDSRKRQASAIELAGRVDMMLVIGGHSSANTNRLAQLCSEVTTTYLIEKSEEIKDIWLRGKEHIGITSGASTSEDTINEVVSRLEAIT